MQDLAKKDFLEAQMLVTNKQEVIKGYFNQIGKSREAVFQAANEGGQFTLSGQQSEQFINLTQIRIKWAQQELRDLMMLAEEQKEVLVEATRELKKFEILKEKKHQEFKKLAQKKEAKELDDMTVMRNGIGDRL